MKRKRKKVGPDKYAYQIPGFPDYGVTKCGEVWSYKRWPNQFSKRQWRKLKASPSKSGRRSHYLYIVGLFKNGKSHPRYVHRLVLETFVGTRPKNMQCRHLDGNTSNNSLQNLSWGTAKENAGDKDEHGNTSKGEQHALAILTESKVRKIRKMRESGNSLKEVADLLGISIYHVSHVANYKSWKHVK